MSDRLTTLAAGLVMAGCFAAPAIARQGPAQDSPRAVQQAERPYRGLFGAGSPAQRGGHALDLTATVSEEYGDTLEGEIPAQPPITGTGWFTGARAMLSYEKAGRFTRFGLRSEGSLRYYRESRETTPLRHRTEMSIDSQIGKTRLSTVHLGGSVEFAPYYVLPFFGAGAPVTGGTAIVPTSRDDLLSRQQRRIYGQTFTLDNALSTRTSLVLQEEARYTQTDGEGLDVRDLRAGVRYSHRMTRYLAFRLGYAYHTGRYGLATLQQLDTHDIDLSFDYRRPLTRSRRTTVGFGSGSMLVNTRPTRRWEVVGFANLRHEMGQGWFLQLDYNRDVQFVEGFMAPFLANTANASLGGFLGRRLEVLTSGGYSVGSVGFERRRYDIVQGSARMRLALSRYLALDGEGLVYNHRFADATPLMASLPRRLDRWAARVSVTCWLPLSR